MRKTKIALIVLLASFFIKSGFAVPNFSNNVSKQELEAKLKATKAEQQHQEQINKVNLEKQNQAIAIKQQEEDFAYIKATTNLIKEPQNKSKTIKDFTYSRYKTFTINVREAMTSTVVLPETETIKSIILGDESSFFVEQISDNIFIVFAQEINRDTSLTAISNNKVIYPFYVKSTAYNSNANPNIVVRVHNSLNKSTLSNQNSNKNLSKAPQNNNLEEDFLKEVPLNPNKIDWNYKMKGNKSIAPKRVWNDGYFTYFEFTEQQSAVLAYKVIENVDTPINATTWQGNIMVVKTVGNITLRSGNKFVCVRPQSNGLKTKTNIKYVPFI